MDMSFTIKRLQVTLTALRRASSRTLVLRLQLPDDETFEYRPGQFVGLHAPDGRPRFFSIANAAPVSGELELHINRAPGGLFTNLLFENARLGDRYFLEGPYGDFAIPHDASPRSILVAGGTGFAPIKACLEQLAALRVGAEAARSLYLYWGVRALEDLYDVASLGALAERLPGLRFVPVLDQAHPLCASRTGLVHRAMIEDFEDLSDFDIYACGAPAMIEALRRESAAERGFDPSRLIADIFDAGPTNEGAALPSDSAHVTVLLDQDGAPRAVEGAVGETLLTALKRAAAPLQAVCGGKGACGTCRIVVSPEWRARTGEAAKREARLLQYLGAGEGDRLSCQIQLTAALDGLELQTCADNKGDAQ
jgi:CDP-4-dehydro-6-deoxyglucose reductase